MEKFKKALKLAAKLIEEENLSLPKAVNQATEDCGFDTQVNLPKEKTNVQRQQRQRKVPSGI